MKNLFIVGNIITTNDRNALKILGVNGDSICVQHLLDGEFSVLSMTEHKYRLYNPKIFIKTCWEDIIGGIKMSEKDRKHILSEMNSGIDSFLKITKNL